MRPENVPKNKRSEIPHIFVPGKRLHSLLLYSIDEKMLYTRSARYKSLYYYRCKSRPCSCRVYCDQNEKCFKVRENHQHNHPDHEEEYKINIIQHKIKERCMQSSGGSVKKIFDETVMQGQHDVSVNFTRMERNLRRLQKNWISKPKKPSKKVTPAKERSSHEEYVELDLANIKVEEDVLAGYPPEVEFVEPREFNYESSSSSSSASSTSSYRPMEPEPEPIEPEPRPKRRKLQQNASSVAQTSNPCPSQSTVTFDQNTTNVYENTMKMQQETIKMQNDTIRMQSEILNTRGDIVATQNQLVQAQLQTNDMLKELINSISVLVQNKK